MIFPKIERYGEKFDSDVVSLQSMMRQWKVKEIFMIEKLIRDQQNPFHINKWDLTSSFFLMWYIIGSIPIKFIGMPYLSLVKHLIKVGLIILSYECFNHAEMQRRRQFNLPPISYLLDREVYKRIMIKERLFSLLIGFFVVFLLKILLVYTKFVIIIDWDANFVFNFPLSDYMNLVIPWGFVLLPYALIRHKIIKDHWKSWWIHQQELTIYKENRNIDKNTPCTLFDVFD